MSWKDLADDINVLCFGADAFGESIIYLPNRGWGDPISISVKGGPINVIRIRRSADEFNPVGAFEGIEIQESDFATLPAIGDVVTLAATDYVITALRDPDPYNLTRVLVLSRRTALAPTP